MEDIIYLRKRLKAAYQRRSYWKETITLIGKRYSVNKRNSGKIHEIREIIEYDIINLKIAIKELSKPVRNKNN